MDTMLQTMFLLSSIIPEMATGGHQSSGIPFGAVCLQEMHKRNSLCGRDM